MQTDNITIGFDAKRAVANASGLGSYSRTLINSLAPITSHQLALYAPNKGRKDLRSQVIEADNVDFRYSKRITRLGQDLWRQRGIVKRLKRDGIDLYHGLSGELPEGITAAGIPTLMTVHDLIFLRHPEFYKPIDVWLYKKKTTRSFKEAKRIIAISECTKHDIQRYFDFPEERIDVVYQSCDTRFRVPPTEEEIRMVKELYQLPDIFYLSVGTIEPRKNAKMLVNCLCHFDDTVHLVFVGRRTPYARELEEMAEKYRITPRLHILDNVPNEHLPAIYHLAGCFAYPSYYEGFGIPIIEAIQSGLCVVAAFGSCLREAGGDSCYYPDPDDQNEWALSIYAALFGDNSARIRIAQKFVERFENREVAGQVLNIYDKMLSENAALR